MFNEQTVAYALVLLSSLHLHLQVLSSNWNLRMLFCLAEAKKNQGT